MHSVDSISMSCSIFKVTNTNQQYLWNVKFWNCLQYDCFLLYVIDLPDWSNITFNFRNERYEYYMMRKDTNNFTSEMKPKVKVLYEVMFLGKIHLKMESCKYFDEGKEL